MSVEDTLRNALRDLVDAVVTARAAGYVVTVRADPIDVVVVDVSETVAVTRDMPTAVPTVDLTDETPG